MSVDCGIGGLGPLLIKMKAPTPGCRDRLPLPTTEVEGGS